MKLTFNNLAGLTDEELQTAHALIAGEIAWREKVINTDYKAERL